MADFTLETDYPSSKSVKIDGQTDGLSQKDYSSMKPFRFHIKTDYPSVAIYPTDISSEADNPSLV